AQATGGNCQIGWPNIEGLEDIGYPIVEVKPDGTFVVTKHEGTGGLVNASVVKEQLLYEIGDPTKYMTPDCTADFTSIRLQDVGPNRVRVFGVRGGERPPAYKISISYHYGWKAIGTLVFSWPDAVAKAREADRIVRMRLQQLGLQFEEVYTELFGYNACHGPAARPPEHVPEVQLRVGVRGTNRKDIDRFTRELIPLVLSGPPTATGYGEGRPAVREIVAYWPALVPRENVEPTVEVVE
ncbi:MAG TPA: acyclic terpene utilization AtuA family protein, partial [Bryobacteraceae bacterium]|nr:acyclic terpene utilization AtuA family protein [Bryobacteraceae bacterium]